MDGSVIKLRGLNLTGSLGHQLSNPHNLKQMNLSHNSLSGYIGNLFIGMGNLREMGLSYNSFAGDLPSSFASLKNLPGLYLQHNNFTGSVTYLSELPLIDLNVQNNYFSGIISKHFQSIPNLWIEGNMFCASNSPPRDFPLETMPIEQNIRSTPRSQSSAIESNPVVQRHGSKNRMGPGGIAFTGGGATLQQHEAQN